jgi:hypothetical protein
MKKRKYARWININFLLLDRGASTAVITLKDIQRDLDGDQVSHAAFSFLTFAFACSPIISSTHCVICIWFRRAQTRMKWI